MVSNLKAISKILISVVFLAILLLPSLAPISVGFSNHDNASAVVNYPYAVSASARIVKDLTCSSMQRVYFSYMDYGQRNFTVSEMNLFLASNGSTYVDAPILALASGQTYSSNKCSYFKENSTTQLEVDVSGNGQSSGVSGSLELQFPVYANGNTYSSATYPKMAFTWSQHLKGGYPSKWSFTISNVGTRSFVLWPYLTGRLYVYGFTVKPGASISHSVKVQHINVGTKTYSQFFAVYSTMLPTGSYYIYLSYMASPTARST